MGTVSNIATPRTETPALVQHARVETSARRHARAVHGFSDFLRRLEAQLCGNVDPPDAVLADPATKPAGAC